MDPRRHSLALPNLDGKGLHEIVFYDWGSEDALNVVICVHGLTRNARDFDYLARALAERGRRVIAITMAGRGESAWLDDKSQYHYGTYVADCLAIMNNFHLRGVDWVGTSMGGVVGMAIAANNPGRIRKLVLNDIGTFLPAAALQRIYAYVTAMPRSFESQEAANTYLREVFAPWNITDQTVWEHFVKHTMAPGEPVRLACDPDIAVPLAADTQGFTQVRDVNLSELWEKIDIPVLILRGAESDLLDEPTVNAMRSTNPRAEAVTISQVGHAPALANPMETGLIANWLVGAGTIKGL